MKLTLDSDLDAQEEMKIARSGKYKNSRDRFYFFLAFSKYISWVGGEGGYKGINGDGWRPYIVM